MANPTSTSASIAPFDPKGGTTAKVIRALASVNAAIADLRSLQESAIPLTKEKLQIAIMDAKAAQYNTAVNMALPKELTDTLDDAKDSIVTLSADPQRMPEVTALSQSVDTVNKRIEELVSLLEAWKKARNVYIDAYKRIATKENPTKVDIETLSIEVKSLEGNVNNYLDKFQLARTTLAGLAKDIERKTGKDILAPGEASSPTPSQG